MKTDTGKTRARATDRASDFDSRKRAKVETGTAAGKLPRRRSQKILRAWIVASSLIALGAVPQAGAQPTDASFTDAVITELVSNALDNDRALTDNDILILTVGRVVYLRGYADTHQQVERAGTLARRVEGVAAVSNAIRVPDRPSNA